MQDSNLDLDIIKEFDSDLGDKRREARLKAVAEAFARNPEASFPASADNPAAIEATYRLLRNSALNYENVSAGHTKATVARCRDLGEVLAIHDWTEFRWDCRDGYMRENLSPLSNGRQGFYAHYTIGASADGLRMPLGTLAMKAYVHRRQADEQTQAFWDERFGKCKSEAEHWIAGFEKAEELLEGCSVIHVCDREADRLGHLKWFADHDGRFVIRWYRRTHKTTAGETFAEALQKAKFKVKRKLDLSSRSLQGVPRRSRTQPERPRRTAVLSFRSVTVEVLIDKERSFPIQLVEAIEQRPPKGQKAVHWILTTSEPAESVDDLLRVVDIYRSRWMVEEFFKAIKTGCSFSKRQLDSASTLLIGLALANAVAWRLLALRYLDREAQTLPASVVLNEVQLALLQHETRKLKWSAKPTVHQALVAFAYIQGYAPGKGPPGWLVLGRGLEKLLNWEVGARLGAKLGLVIND
jgi:hypothetical protein